MYFYMPLPVVIALFAALASGATVTIWFALSKRRLGSIGNQDTKF